MLTGKEVYGKNQDAFARVIEGKALIIMPSSGQSVVLNETATRVWKLMDGKQSLEEIIAAFCTEFDVSKSKAKKDILEIVSSMEKEKIIVLRGR